MAYQGSENTSKVLLVDDEDNILRALTRLLMEDDLEVLTASSGEAGLKVLQAEGDVALVLSDQRMPGMSGAEFLQQARVLAPDAVRMVLTGYADINATMDAINKGGASRYITKPWDDEALLHAIREGLEHYRLVRENKRLSALVEKQNAELKEWNDGLKGRVMEQTATIRRQNEELKGRNQQIDRAFRHTIVAFSRLVELHSSRLQEHTRNVTELCERMGAALKLDGRQAESLRTAALLHDIGVIGIPVEILAKPLGRMNRDELDIFLQHAVRGQATVDEVEELREAGLLIRHHHEFYGGGGFPDGISGERIPLGARIITCADFVDREMEDERGEPALTVMLERARRALGSALDPALFPVLEKVVQDVYRQPRSQRAEAAEKELRPRQLMAGMQLTRDVYTRSGLLLLPKGTVLDAGKIASLLRTCAIDPLAGSVYVSWRIVSSEQRIGGSAGQKPGSLERELGPGKLLQGMRLTRNLYSGTGLLLLAEGTVLDDFRIVSVERYYRIDPPSSGVFVEAEKAP